MKKVNYIRALILIFSFFLTSANAQKDKIDSLLLLLKTDKEDTIKINHLYILGWELKYNNPDTSIILGIQALTIAEKLNWKKGIANSLGNLGVYYRLKADYSKALDYYLKALSINEEMLREAKNISEKQSAKKGITTRLGNIGNIYRNQANYSKALEFYLKALKIAEELGNSSDQAIAITGKNGIATILNNIGNVYSEQADYPNALDNYLKALKIDEELGNKNGIATDLGNIGFVYSDQSEYSKALDYYLQALKMDEEIGNKNGTASDLSNIGNVYSDQGNHPKALGYYLKALKLSEEIGNKNLIAIQLGNIGGVYYNKKEYSKTLDYFLGALKIDEEIENINGVARYLGNIGLLYSTIAGTLPTQKLRQQKFKEAEVYLKKAIHINDSIGAKNELREWSESLSNLYDTTARYKLALIYYKKAMVLKDTIFSEEKKKELVRKAMTFQFEMKEAVAKVEYGKEIAVKEAVNKKQKTIIYLMIAGILLLTLLFGIILYVLGLVKKERAKSEKLLLNILPKDVAEELKTTGSTTPKYYKSVSVLFTDFKGFTILSEQMSAKELVAELHYIFIGFDRINIKYNIEKIKTIGDSYMCVGGIPVENSTHPFDTVNAALEIKQFMDNYKQQRISEGKLFFEIRIGVHTGPVVAGVVGENKFAYDIWGDTVNTASRMESSGEPGKVNISGATYELIKDKFVCEQRGEVEAKNKGVIKMFFVKRKII